LKQAGTTTYVLLLPDGGDLDLGVLVLVRGVEGGGVVVQPALRLAHLLHDPFDLVFRQVRVPLVARSVLLYGLPGQLKRRSQLFQSAGLKLVFLPPRFDWLAQFLRCKHAKVKQSLLEQPTIL